MNLMSRKTRITEAIQPALVAVKDAANALIAVAVVAVAALVLSIIALVRTKRSTA